MMRNMAKHTNEMTGKIQAEKLLSPETDYQPDHSKLKCKLVSKLYSKVMEENFFLKANLPWK